MFCNPEIRLLIAELNDIAPGGYHLGLHVRQAMPMVCRSTYPDHWLKVYNAQSYLLCDPVVIWSLQQTGVIRWRDVGQPDPLNVMGHAWTHGLRYGAVASCGPVSSRSIIGISRPDREFYDTELDRLGEVAQALHQACVPAETLTNAQCDALRLIANGDRYAAAAPSLGITESALKARLKSARVRLQARTTSEAIRKAREFRLL
ncbi:LuxR family transcriptional regulator [Rhodobacteraceae bacterium]|nr:LuxR family transcriptional regulator [Paracoccaceae bacterium]